MVIATTGDLMERMEAEEALEKSLATSEQALRELPDPKFALDQHAVVGVTDVHGTITHVNEKFRAISQHSGDELIGQNHPQEFFQQMYHSILAVPSRPPPARRRAKFHSVLRSLTLFLFTALALAATAVAQQDLTQLSLEDLMDTKVTSEIGRAHV